MRKIILGFEQYGCNAVLDKAGKIHQSGMMTGPICERCKLAAINELNAEFIHGLSEKAEGK